jgi:diphthamide synthase (EF-2-diphthine--ammonia ligase)
MAGVKKETEMQRYELEAWLGPALAEMTPDQVDAMARYADTIEDRYDDDALRGLAAGGALLITRADSTLEQLGRALARARREERETMAILAGAIIASADTDSEASLARRAGVTRVTVRRALGK